MKKNKFHYSGKKSEKFWDKINSHRGRTKDLLYVLGCCLQDIEYRTLKALEDNEFAKSYPQKKYNE